MKEFIDQQEQSEYEQRFVTSDEEREQIKEAIENARLRKKFK